MPVIPYTIMLLHNTQIQNNHSSYKVIPVNEDVEDPSIYNIAKKDVFQVADIDPDVFSFLYTMMSTPNCTIDHIIDTAETLKVKSTRDVQNSESIKINSRLDNIEKYMFAMDTSVLPNITQSLYQLDQALTQTNSANRYLYDTIRSNALKSEYHQQQSNRVITQDVSHLPSLINGSGVIHTTTNFTNVDNKGVTTCSQLEKVHLIDNNVTLQQVIPTSKPTFAATIKQPAPLPSITETPEIDALHLNCSDEKQFPTITQSKKH